MAVFCPECENITYDEYQCDKCNCEIKKKNKSQKMKYKEVNKYGNNQDKTLKIIIASALVVIAIVGVFFMYQKYQENRMNAKAMEMIFGTSDINEIEKKLKNTNKKNREMMNRQMKEYKKNLEKLNKSIEKSSQMFNPK